MFSFKNTSHVILWVSVATMTLLSSLSLASAEKVKLPPDILKKKVCTATEIADLKAVVDQEIAARADIKTLKLSNNSTVTKVLQRSMPTPCVPVFDISAGSNQSLIPKNVKTIMGVLSPKVFSEIVMANPGKADGNGPGPLAGYEANYVALLSAAARYPYFCDDQGNWSSATESCKRELATMFAHAAQETGNGNVSSVLNYTREQNCYTSATGCGYDVGKETVNAPSSAHFYGRGMKQLTYWFNYQGFSSSFIEDYNKLINKPDEVAEYGYYIFGSGIWFYMTPQNPKPSIHDVVVGNYVPNSSNIILPWGTVSGVQGVYVTSGTVQGSVAVPVNSDGTLRDRFIATISIINGGPECAPSAVIFESWTNGDQGLQKSRNRVSYYLSYLQKFGATRTQEEQGYTSGVTFCNYPSGAAFGDASLKFDPPIFLDTVGSPASQQVGQNADGSWKTDASGALIYEDVPAKPATCEALSWQGSPPLNIAADPYAYQSCVSKFLGKCAGQGCS